MTEEPASVWQGVLGIIQAAAKAEAAILHRQGDEIAVVAATSPAFAARAAELRVTAADLVTIACEGDYNVVVATPANDPDARDVIAGIVCNVVALGDRVTQSARRDAELNEFLARLQHSLRTPLTALLGMGELADSYWDSWDDAARREVVADSRIAAEHLYRLTDALTDELMIESGRWKPERTELEVADLVREAVDDVQHHRGDVTSITADIGELPPLMGDRERLVQAISALLDNAVCFGSDGEPIAISAVHDPHKSVAIIEVINRGEPIAAERIQGIFEPFTRGTPPSGRRYNGLGMGLPIARRIARAHGGDVSVSSDPQATRARITLPLAEE